MKQEIKVLFPAEPFLEKRVGKERFDSVPQLPGVYRFFDQRGELLYVGKAKNLRKRLFSYKRARAGQVSRKVSRLIGRIVSFEVEVTDTEQEAFLLENHLIRRERPPFNHANKQTETYYYVYMRPGRKELEFRLSMRIHEETDEAFWHGCFKGHRPVRESLGCLLRLIWMAEHNVRSPMNLPVQLTRNLTPLNFKLNWHPGCSPALRDGLPEILNGWIRGETCELLDWLIVRIECGNHLTPFQIRTLEIHLEILKQFYDHKLVRHRQIRNGRDRIGQEEIDDLLLSNRTIEHSSNRAFE